jgi:hypothetical protein
VNQRRAARLAPPRPPAPPAPPWRRIGSQTVVTLTITRARPGVRGALRRARAWRRPRPVSPTEGCPRRGCTVRIEPASVSWFRKRRKVCCASVRDCTTERQKCASSWLSELSVIYEIVRFFSTPYLVSICTASTVRKLTARSAERQVHGGSRMPISENTTSTRSGG